MFLYKFYPVIKPRVIRHLRLMTFLSKISTIYVIMTSSANENMSIFGYFGIFLKGMIFRCSVLPWQLSYFKVREMCVNKAIISYISFVCFALLLAKTKINEIKLLFHIFLLLSLLQAKKNIN